MCFYPLKRYLLISFQAPDEMFQNIVTSLDAERHARFRKALSTSFTETSLRNQSPLIEFFADLLIDHLNDLVTSSTSPGSGTIIDIFQRASWFAVMSLANLRWANLLVAWRIVNFIPGLTP